MWNVCTLDKIRQFHCYSSEVCGGRLIYVLSEKEKKKEWFLFTTEELAPVGYILG